MKSFSNTKRASKLRNAEHEQVVYTTLARASICKLANTTNPMRGQSIQHLLPRKLERKVYTTLATTITYEGSACSTCKHENLSEQCIQHLQTRTFERAVHTAPANMNTWGQCIQHLQTRKLRAVHRAPANTKTYAGSAYSTCKHENVRGQCIQQQQTRQLERTTLAKGADKHLQLRLHKRLYQFLSHRRFMKLHRVSCKTISFNREEWPTVVGTQQDRQIVRQLIKEQRSNAQFTLRFGIFA